MDVKSLDVSDFAIKKYISISVSTVFSRVSRRCRADGVRFKRQNLVPRLEVHSTSNIKRNTVSRKLPRFVYYVALFYPRATYRLALHSACGADFYDRTTRTKDKDNIRICNRNAEAVVTTRVRS